MYAGRVGPVKVGFWKMRIQDPYIFRAKLKLNLLQVGFGWGMCGSYARLVSETTFKDK